MEDMEKCKAIARYTRLARELSENMSNNDINKEYCEKQMKIVLEEKRKLMEIMKN